MKKLIFLLLTFSGVIPYSCNDCTGVKFNPVQVFNINSFALNTAALDGSMSDTSLFIPYDSVAKALTIKEKTYVANHENRGYSFFITSAIACDPVPPQSNSMETITGIQIISRSHFIAPGDTIEPGDTVSTSFLIGQPVINNFVSIQQYTDSKEQLHETSCLLIRFNKVPQGNTEFKFDFFVTLSNNAVHSFTDQTLKIK